MSQTIILKQAIEYDFEEYVQDNTFDFYIDFFQDAAGLTPTDLTGSDFVMAIHREDGHCCFRDQLREVLGIGTGLSLSVPPGGTVLNRLNISKVLESHHGLYRQSITWTDTGNIVFTCEKGKLRIDKKV